MENDEKSKPEGIAYWFGRLEQLIGEQGREIREIRVEQFAQKKTLTDLASQVALHDKKIADASRSAVDARRSSSDLSDENKTYQAAVANHVDKITDELATLKANDEQQNLQIAKIDAKVSNIVFSSSQQTKSLASLKLFGPLATAIVTAIVAAIAKYLFS